MIILIILIALLFSAFFSGMEIAFVSANRLQIAIKTQQSNGVVSKILAHFAHKPGWFISAMLIGNNATVVVYSICLAQLIDPILLQWFENDILIVVVQTIFATVILLFFAEFLPKTIFRINPNNTLTVLAIPVFIIYILLFLPSIIIISITELVMLLLIKKENRTQEKIVFEKTDLDAYLAQTLRENAQTNNQDYEVKLFHKALSFSEVIARDCMIPRNEIIAVDINESIEILKKTFIETEVSKILVFKDNIDNIIGYVHSFEMFKNPENIKNILWPVSIIPETMSANKILQELLKKNRSMAIVLDEYGGTAGLVTMEDIIEEIFGEIDDEHDTEEKESVQISANEYRFSGRLEIDYINEKYNLNLPVSEEYETLGGFLISRFRDIPSKGAQLDYEHYHFVIEDVAATKIQTVYLRVEL
jgi:CBS domain containing-hemolysin-like protein